MMLILDGILNPYPQPSIYLCFEFLTILMEGFVMVCFIDFEKPITRLRAVMMLIVMNLSSMLLSIPFWSMIK